MMSEEMRGFYCLRHFAKFRLTRRSDGGMIFAYHRERYPRIYISLTKEEAASLSGALATEGRNYPGTCIEVAWVFGNVPYQAKDVLLSVRTPSKR